MRQFDGISHSIASQVRHFDGISHSTTSQVRTAVPFMVDFLFAWVDALRPL